MFKLFKRHNFEVIMIKYIKGDLVRDAEIDFDLIGHGCNCFRSFGAGIAKDVRDNYIGAYQEDLKTRHGATNKLGKYTMWANDNIIILNLYTQYKYGNDSRNADYDAIRSCMRAIKTDFSGKKIGLPFIGAGLAKGDWGIISDIISEELDGEDVTVVIWEKSNKKWQLDLLVNTADLLDNSVEARICKAIDKRRQWYLDNEFKEYNGELPGFINLMLETNLSRDASVISWLYLLK